MLFLVKVKNRTVAANRVSLLNFHLKRKFHLATNDLCIHIRSLTQTLSSFHPFTFNEIMLK